MAPFLLSSYFPKLERLFRKSPYALPHLRDKKDEDSEEELTLLDDRIDRERFIKSIKDANLLAILSNLMQGDNLKEIAARRNTTVQNIYKKLAVIKRMRQEWER